MRAIAFEAVWGDDQTQKTRRMGHWGGMAQSLVSLPKLGFEASALALGFKTPRVKEVEQPRMASYKSHPSALRPKTLGAVNPQLGRMQNQAEQRWRLNLESILQTTD